jgi:hypothetical protein
MSYFDSKAEETANMETSKLSFTKIDTGDFLFHNFEETPVFVGKYKGHWAEEDGKPVKGLEFEEYFTGQRYILSENYRLLDFFIHNQMTDINYKTGVFQITYKGKKEISKGQTLSLFDFQVA